MPHNFRTTLARHARTSLMLHSSPISPFMNGEGFSRILSDSSGHVFGTMIELARRRPSSGPFGIK